MLRRALLLAALLGLAATPLPATSLPPLPERPGFGRFDAGYTGTFEDLLLNRLELARSGSSLTGSLSYLGEWRISAKATVDGLSGQASAGAQKKPFRARRVGEVLEVTLGNDTLRLHRTVAADDSLADLGPVQTDAGRRWTIAVYLGGDNNLEANALQDLADMVRTLPPTGVEIVVLLDRAQGFAADEADDWTGTRLFRLRPGRDQPELLRDVGERNTGDAATLGNFLVGVFRTFPAEHYAAVLWDHGGGWGGIVEDLDAPGFNGGACMLDLRDIRVALRSAYFRATHRRLDLLAFDACLMSQLEVALQVSDLADLMVASEAEVPGSGFPYEDILPFFADRQRSPRDVATAMVEAFAQSYATAQDPGTTLSALDLAHVADVAAALDEFAGRCLPAVASQWPAFSRALYYGESYEPRSRRSKAGHTPSLDLTDLLTRIENGLQPFPAAAELANLRAKLAQTVLASRTGDSRRLSHGLAVFGPRFSSQRAEGYAITPLGRRNRWPELMAAVHDHAKAGSQAPVTFSDVSIYATQRDGTTVVHPLDGDRIDFTVHGQGIVQVLQWDAVRDGEGFAILRKTWVPDPVWMSRAKQGYSDLSDLFMPQFNDGATRLSTELVGLRFVVASGGSSANLTLDATGLGIDSPFTARAKLRRGGCGEPVDVEVYFDRAWWRAEAIFEIPRTQGVTPRRAQPQPDDELAFIIETITEDGTRDEVEATPLRWGAGLMLVPVADEPGDYRTYLGAVTMDGRESVYAVDYPVEENATVAAWRESWTSWTPETMREVWNQQLATGPEQWQAIGNTARFGGSLPGHPGVMTVVTEFGPPGQREQLHQTWVFDTRGVPTLRIIQELEGGRTLCWYGPACFSGQIGKPWVAMKALQVGGVLWRWEFDFLESLRIPD